MKKHILVVDDSPLMHAMLSDLLKSFGYAAVCASSGQEGCELLENNQFDLIITDLNMPRMDGLAFVRIVRQMTRYEHLPIVVMTGEGDRRRIDEVERFGISTFLEKPFRGSQLKPILQAVFDYQ